MSITPDTPKIGGQKMDYIVYALKSYQNVEEEKPRYYVSNVCCLK